MKAYGIPRCPELIYPDLDDLRNFALKPSKGNVPNKSGQIRSFFKKSSVKKRTRRFWKKKARNKWKRKISLTLREI